MYKERKIAVVIPAYNEERLIAKTIRTLPTFIDTVIIVNDASTDRTHSELKKLQKQHKRILVITNKTNRGVGYSVKRGLMHAVKDTTDDVIGVMAGDAQCDPDFIAPMIDDLIESSIGYVKANRFYHRDALKAMPRYRRFGNILISLLTKFSTGYYSISDSQNGYGFFNRTTLEMLSFDFINDRYDYENTLLVALAINNVIVKDHPVPAIYGVENSTIKFIPTAIGALQAVWQGFWKRIYYKYVLFSFHPIALFLICGLFLTLSGLIFSIVLLLLRLINNVSPSAGTVMLAVLPVLFGFQLLLAAITMDMNNERKR